MKHKEKVHLKEDPFVHFIEKIVRFFKEKKRIILLNGSALLILAAAVTTFLVIRSAGYNRDNRIATEALKIKMDVALSSTEKIDRLKKLGAGSGLAAAIPLYIAQIHYENGEWPKALAALQDFESSRYGHINDGKKLLEAEILKAMGKKEAAEAVISAMLADPRTETGKDFLLLQLAKSKIAGGQVEAAKGFLQQIARDFPASNFGPEAQDLLSSLEEK